MVESSIDLFAADANQEVMNRLIGVMLVLEDWGTQYNQMGRAVVVVDPIQPLVDLGSQHPVVPGIPMIGNTGMLVRRERSEPDQRGSKKGYLINEVFCNCVRLPKDEVVFYQGRNGLVRVDADVFLAVLFGREQIDVDYFNGDVAVREDEVDKAAIRRHRKVVQLQRHC